MCIGYENVDITVRCWSDIELSNTFPAINSAHLNSRRKSSVLTALLVGAVSLCPWRGVDTKDSTIQLCAHEEHRESSLEHNL